MFLKGNYRFVFNLTVYMKKKDEKHKTIIRELDVKEGQRQLKNWQLYCVY